MFADFVYICITIGEFAFELKTNNIQTIDTTINIHERRVRLEIPLKNIKNAKALSFSIFNLKQTRS